MKPKHTVSMQTGNSGAKCAESGLICKGLGDFFFFWKDRKTVSEHAQAESIPVVLH